VQLGHPPVLQELAPRMLSRKCTCQLSSLLTLPMERRCHPRHTVCALPNNDLHTTATRFALLLARWPPAGPPPAPMTTTS